MSYGPFSMSEAIASDIDDIIDVWEKAGLVRPWNDPRQDCCRALEGKTSALFVAKANDNVIGSVMAGYEGHRGWIYYLSVLPDYQSSGAGKQLYFHAEKWLKEQGAPKIQILVRKDNDKVIGFYEKIGFEVSTSILMGKKIEH